MEYIFGFLPGIFLGIGLGYLYMHKSEIEYLVTCMKEDIANIQVKLDRVLNNNFK